MSKIDNDEIVEFKTQKEWEHWISKEHDKKLGVWIKMAKKGKGVTTITYSEALDVALCYGWIDGIMRRVDDVYVIQRFSPRGKRSIWSKINVGKVETLIKAGKMQPSGMVQVEAAKADGRWMNAYGGQASMEVPADFKDALGRHKKAAEFFNTLSNSNRYSILFQIHHAKRPETRARRIQKFIQMLSEGKKPY